ncbi:MAG: thiamine diphosphokinase [Bacteroidetes bacterium]|nr:thiamine diphosphokinase [Bacteroidota bacterium]
MSKKIIIVSGGRFGDPIFFKKKIAEIGASLIIVCDGGVRHLQKLGIKPDVIIGDMDSIEPAQLANYSAQGVQIIKYPANKDFTDTELALDYALNLKPTTIYIWGALGGRLDHTLANVFLLRKGKDVSIKTYLIDEYCEAFIVDKEAVFVDAKGVTISLFAFSPKVEGLSLSGFVYPLQDAILSMGESRGVSNIINEADAKISVRVGNLLVIRYWQKGIFPEAL